MLNQRKLLLLGGTGYLGQRLALVLLDMGYAVRVVTRRPHMARQWLPNVEVVYGDVRVSEVLLQAMSGCVQVVSALRLSSTDEPQVAAQVMFAAQTLGIAHVLWVSALYPERPALKKICAAQEGMMSVCLVRLGPLIGFGSVFAEVQDRLKRYPRYVAKWVSRRHRISCAIEVREAVQIIAQAVVASQHGVLVCPKVAVSPLPLPAWRHRLWAVVAGVPWSLAMWAGPLAVGQVDPLVFCDPHADNITYWEASPEPSRVLYWGIALFEGLRERPYWSFLAEGMALSSKVGQYQEGYRLLYADHERRVWQCFLRVGVLRVTHMGDSLAVTWWFCR